MIWTILNILHFLLKRREKLWLSNFKTNQEISTLSKGYVPTNAKNNCWAVKVFNEWRTHRNQSVQEEKCPSNLLEKPDVSKLNYWLAHSVAEVTTENIHLPLKLFTGTFVITVIQSSNSRLSLQAFSDNYRMAKTTKWLNAILDYMKKVKSSISMVYGLVF